MTEGNNKRNFHSPTKEQEKIATNILRSTEITETEIPEQALGFRIQAYGITKHQDFFTDRQLNALYETSFLISEARQKILQDGLNAGLYQNDHLLQDGGRGAFAYAEAVSIFLTFAIDRCADYWSNVTSWHSSKELIRNTFARHAMPMVWDYTEANPFSNSSGNFFDLLKWIPKVLEKIPASPSAFVQQVDAANFHTDLPLIISTDPPYYDNISYADLSDFFYVWMRVNLRDIYPSIFSTLLVPKTPELVATPFRFDGDINAANKHFEKGLMKAFSQMRQFTIPEYPLTIYYAFKQQELIAEENAASTGWETMLAGLIDSGFSIVGTWPIRTELSNRIRNIGSNALASSIVLVCRPRPENALITSRREFVNALRRELPAALREMQSGNIAPVDLAQASIGPGMAVYSRYRQVLEANGSRLTVRAALQLINQVLDEYLAESEGDLDGDSRFAVAWFEQYGFNAGEFGTADVLARAKNTSVDGLRSASILEASVGKVRLLTWEELDPGWDPAADTRPTVWEATHHLIERLNVHGEEGAALLLAKLSPELAADARQLAYRLYSICERKGWADHARDYNALVISWSSSQERATAVKQTYQQRGLFD